MPGVAYLLTKHSGQNINLPTRTIVEFSSDFVSEPKKCKQDSCFSIPFHGRDISFRFVSLLSFDIPNDIPIQLNAYDKDLNLLTSDIGTIYPSDLIYFPSFSAYRYALVSININSVVSHNWFIPGNAEDEENSFYGTPFRRICDEELCTTSLVWWGTCKDIFGIPYHSLTEDSEGFNLANSFEQNIRLDMMFRNSELKEDAKVYKRSDGVTLKVNSRYNKIWNLETGYIPEHATEAIIYMASHDYFIMSSSVTENMPVLLIQRRLILDSFEYVKDNAPGLPTGNSKLKLTMTESVYNKYRSYCSNCLD